MEENHIDLPITWEGFSAVIDDMDIMYGIEINCYPIGSSPVSDYMLVGYVYSDGSFRDTPIVIEDNSKIKDKALNVRFIVK